MPHVSIVYCPAATAPWETQVDLPETTTIGQALEQSGVLSAFAELRLDTISVGVFSRPRRLDDPVRDGDRIEIYRPLIVDPKVARRRRAELKRTRGKTR